MKPRFWVLEVPGEMGSWKQTEQGLSLFFCQILGIIDDIFRVQHAEGTMKLWKIVLNMPKIWQQMKKSLVQLALNPFFNWFWIPENLILSTQSITRYDPILQIQPFLRMKSFFCTATPWPQLTWASVRLFFNLSPCSLCSFKGWNFPAHFC